MIQPNQAIYLCMSKSGDEMVLQRIRINCALSHMKIKYFLISHFGTYMSSLPEKGGCCAVYNKAFSHDGCDIGFQNNETLDKPSQLCAWS